MKKFYLAIYHFRFTLLCLAIGYFIAVYFQVHTPGSYLIAAFMGWLQSFVDKVREIGRQLEQERRNETELAIPSINWRLLFAKSGKAAMVLVLGLLLLAVITYLYLYVRLRP
jgi:hypothetical protein